MGDKTHLYEWLREQKSLIISIRISPERAIKLLEEISKDKDMTLEFIQAQAVKN